MTLIEVFEQVARHLLTQNQKSKKNRLLGDTFNSSNNGCAYRGDNGLRCAVGCLIPDDLYIPAMETDNADDPHVWTALVQAGVPNTRDAKLLLRELQRIHDNSSPPVWPQHLLGIRNSYLPKIDPATPLFPEAP